MDIESCLRNSLTEINDKYNNHLRSLCFSVPLFYSCIKLTFLLDHIEFVDKEMNQVKRELRFNRSYYVKINNLRSTSKINQKIISITCIENLCDEIFYEIFDYLNAYNIYKTFSNLNYRFQRLLNSSSLLLKIKSHFMPPSVERLMNNFKQLILFNKQQIFSIDLSFAYGTNQFCTPFTVDSSFYRLESITLMSFKPNVLMSILQTLISLPRLFSLTIYIPSHLEDLTDIYQIILTLPMLKYYELRVNNTETSVSLPIATNKQFSPIECLLLDHDCTFEEIATITSYTPQLRRLYFKHTDESDSNIEMFVRIPLSNLTFISILEYPQEFDEFEMFISEIQWKLKVLCISTRSEDIDYFNANRWEELILKYLPHLKKFYLQYEEECPEDNKYLPYFDELNQFTSSFWIERQWIFEAEIWFGDITYLVQPYKKRWYDYDEQFKVITSSSSNQISKSSRLILKSFPSDESLDLFSMDIERVLAVTQIYHLEISEEDYEENIFSYILTGIVNLLTELDSLRINSLSLCQPTDLCDEEVELICLAENINKITKVNLKKMIEIQEIYFLMKLCPYMEYLKVDSINNMNVKLFLRNILKKIKHGSNKYLRLLCIRVPAADDEMIIKLEKMINTGKLLVNYSIKRILDNIYLQWK